MEIDAGNNLETFKTGSGSEEAVEVHDFQIVSRATLVLHVTHSSVGLLGTPCSALTSLPQSVSGSSFQPATQTFLFLWFAFTGRQAVASKTEI